MKYVVVFLNESGVKVAKTFDSAFYARKFVQRLNHSKKCRVLSCPLFD
jgi:hypothetical protein